MTHGSVVHGTSGTFGEGPARELRWRVIGSILGGTGWLIFVLLFIAFVPTGFTLFQSIVVVLVSILALGAILGAMWASWGMRHAV